jgi:adenylate cyclase
MRKNALRRLFIGNLIGLTTAVVIIVGTEVLFPEFFDNFEAKSLDIRYYQKIKKLEASRGGQTIDDIVIIDIDNRSLNQLGRFQQWPRDYYTDIVKFVSESGAIVIGFDVLFMEQDIDRVADTLLVHATRKAGNVCHSLSFSKAEPDAFLYKMETPPAELDTSGFSYLFSEDIVKHFPEADRFDGKFFKLYNVARKLGFVNFQPDNDSVIRKMPLFMNFVGELYPSLAMAMILYLYDVKNNEIEIKPGKFVKLNLPSGKNVNQITIPIDDQGQMLINYLGSYQTFRYISFYDVWANRIPAEFFKGKVVLIGASAAGLYDLRPVPFQNAFPGVEIHANILCNILTQNFIYRTPKLVSCIILVLLCMAISSITIFFRIRINIPIIFIISAGFVYSTFFFFSNYNLWIENVRPIIGIIFCHISLLTYRYLDESKDKRKIKGMFQHYISATVVDELLKNPGMLKLGGERKIATAFFSDIKNFTSVAESLEPEKLVSVLNEYLSAMTDIVLRYEGYLDKYEGDAIVSIFGIPVEQQDHAVRACNAALDMRKELVILKEIWKRQGKPAFEVRIGLNSGSMIAGNIGGKERFDYTAIGDSVNLASRLESANKMYGTSIIMSEETFYHVHEKFWCRELDFIRVKGKSNPVRIYELIGRKTEEIDPIRSSSLEYFLKGLEIYRNRDWIHAYNFFQKALTLNSHDGPSQEFIRRCKKFIENPRPVDWDGVFELNEK